MNFALLPEAPACLRQERLPVRLLIMELFSSNQ